MNKQVLERLNLGGKIKELRKQRGLTLKELAEKTGFSPALLSQVENNLVSPSISTLWNFAEALGLKIGYFFQQEGVDGEDYVLTPAGRGTRIHRNELTSAVPCEDLAFGLEERNMSPFLVRCEKDCRLSGGEVTYEGEEFLLVMDGALVVEYGEQRFDLGPGDSMYYNAQIPHRIEASRGSRFLAVVFEGQRR